MVRGRIARRSHPFRARSFGFAALPVLLLLGCWEFPKPDAGPEPGSGSLAGRILVAGDTGVSGQYAPDPRAIEQARARIAVAQQRSTLPPADPPVTPMGVPLSRPAATSPDAAEPAPAPKQGMEWRRGEVNVLFERARFDKAQLAAVVQRMFADAQLAAKLGDVRIAVGSCSALRLCLVTLTKDGAPLSLDDTTLAAKALHAVRAPGVKVVARNFIKRGYRIPNDPFYFYQWHYEFARLPGAWDITTGADDIVVAVIDSGLVRSHPDIIDRALAGIDAIESEDIAADGNGRDTDSTDPGDNLFGNGQHSFHGTHVAGTIGAETNNGEGTAGVMWAGKILPVRALGLQLGGTDSDILASILWSVGDPNIDGLPVNQDPAKIINLSLGGETDSEGTAVWQEIVTLVAVDADDVFGKPILVCAAGNSDAEAATIVPANLDHMITVGATRYDGKRAGYSNRGDKIDIMAPGGDEGVDLNADGQPDGVLSLYGNDYNFEQGTSMSSPHVAGIIGLVVSIQPNMDHALMEELLKLTADPAGQCNEGCGAGHVDALSAVLTAGGTIPQEPLLSVDQSQIFFGDGIAQGSINVRNLGNSPLEFTATVTGAQAQLFTVDTPGGTLPASSAATITVTLNRADFGAGSANLEIQGIGAAATQAALVNLGFDNGAQAPAPTLQTIQVGAYAKNEEDGRIGLVQSAIASRANGFDWKIEGLAPGEYFIYGVADEDNNGLYDPQREGVGAYPLTTSPKIVVLETDGEVTGLDFSLSSGFVIDDPGGVGAPCAANTDCSFAPDAECITAWNGGYCSRECGGDGYCGLNGSCENLTCEGDQACAVCLASCVTVSQCRGDDGFVCDKYGTCTPSDF